MEILPQIHAGIAEQIDFVPLLLQLLHQLSHALHGQKRTVPPAHDDFLHSAVEMLGQAGIHLLHHTAQFNGAVVRLHPLHALEELRHQKRLVCLRQPHMLHDFERRPVNQNLAHIKHNGRDLLIHKDASFPTFFTILPQRGEELQEGFHRLSHNPIILRIFY